MIVTIDGPAGSGKSTAARELSKRLGFQFLDTGAMYRVLAWASLQRGIDPKDMSAIAELANRVEIRFSSGRVLADGVDVSDAIRSPDVTRGSSMVALNPQVRTVLAEQQRRAAQGLDIVTEGRDQGTVVFPDAECKFFLTADPDERALRRHRELQRKSSETTLDEIRGDIVDRDRRDQSRAISPLVPASDAKEIDTTDLDQTEVVDLLERLVRLRMKEASAGTV